MSDTSWNNVITHNSSYYLRMLCATEIPNFLILSIEVLQQCTTNKNPLATIPLLSKITVIKIEAHTKRTEPEYQGNSLADFHAKAA